jgi:alcohol dehydrogenase class IV
LGAIGMKRNQIGEMAELASVKRLLDNSPVAFDKEALVGILEEAY